MNYWVITLTRNGEDTVAQCLESVLNQTIPPILVCIVDDGSTDETPSILEAFSSKFPGKNHIITLPDRGFDIRRVVHNLNLAIRRFRRLGVKTKYTLITGDDCVYPDNYAEFILNEMERDPRLVVASGDIEGYIQDVTPRGSGRFVNNRFFEKIGGMYPPYYGYESWILHKALQLGYRIQNFSELRYKHLRMLGKKHRFCDWGLAMKCLGYHALEVVYRCIKYVLVDRRLPLSYFMVLWDFFIRPFTLKNDPYFQYFNDDLRGFIGERQKRNVIRRIALRIRATLWDEDMKGRNRFISWYVKNTGLKSRI